MLDFLIKCPPSNSGLTSSSRFIVTSPTKLSRCRKKLTLRFLFYHRSVTLPSQTDFPITLKIMSKTSLFFYWLRFGKYRIKPVELSVPSFFLDAGYLLAGTKYGLNCPFWTGVKLSLSLLWYQPCYFSNAICFVIMYGTNEGKPLSRNQFITIVFIFCKKPSQVDKVQLYSTREYKLSCIWTMPYTRINKESFNTLCARWNLLISK